MISSFFYDRNSLIIQDEDLQNYVKESFEKEGLPEPEINPNIRMMY